MMVHFFLTLLVCFASVSQTYLLNLGRGERNSIPYWTFPRLQARPLTTAMA